MTITIEKAWDGNECVTEANNRVYVSAGRWQWLLLVDGEVYDTYDRKRDAVAHIEIARRLLTPATDL